MRLLKYKKTAKRRNTSRHAINSERVKMRVSKGDTVRVMRGDDRFRLGEVVEWGDKHLFADRVWYAR